MKTSILIGLLFACMTSLSAEVKPWVEKKIYATSGLGEREDIIISVNALFPPEDAPVIARNEESVTIVHWDKATMKSDLKEQKLPSNVGKMISDLEKISKGIPEIQKSPARKYKYERDEYVYSADIFPPYLDKKYILQSFGRVFFIPEFKKPVSVLRVSGSGLSNIKIHYCALDARNGQLPIYYECAEQKLHLNLGLVSLKTGEIQPIGTWDNSPSIALRSGPIAWIDDNTLALVAYTRGTTYWGIFDIGKKKIIARDQGNWDEDKHVLSFIIKDGRLYGLLGDNKVVQLYPLPN